MALTKRILGSKTLAALASPHGVDRYLEMVNPMWAATEVRARVVDIHRENPDSDAAEVATLAADVAARGNRNLEGDAITGALLAEGLVDRYYWVQSPLWLGATAVPAVAGLPTVPLADARRWRVAERRALGDDTLLVLDRP